MEKRGNSRYNRSQRKGKKRMMMERSRIRRVEKDLLSLKAGKNNETVQNQGEGKAREGRKPLFCMILEGKTETREEMRGSKYLN